MRSTMATCAPIRAARTAAKTPVQLPPSTQGSTSPPREWGGGFPEWKARSKAQCSWGL
jgi:hypothetical protein